MNEDINVPNKTLCKDRYHNKKHDRVVTKILELE